MHTLHGEHIASKYYLASLYSLYRQARAAISKGLQIAHALDKKLQL